MLLLFGWALSFADVTAVDAETVSKKIGASFHWFPVQKSFILVTEKDTAKFAVGIPYASVNGSTIDLTASPVLDDGHLWIAEEDVNKLFPPKSEVKASETKATAAKTEPAKTEPAKAADKKEAAKDAAKTVTATKPKNETAGTREVKTIVIDPGHGGKDSGALGKNAQEKDIVLAVSKLLKKDLEKAGFNVKMTRDKDVFIELGQRANLANQWDGDLFISLHCNAIDASAERKKQIKGFHVYVLRAPESEEDKAIARRENKVATLYGEKNAKEELSPIEWFKLEARLEKYKQNSYMFTEEMLKAMDGGKIKRQAGGVGGAGFMVLVGALMPAVLFEIGFISNLEDEAYMMSKAGQEDIAARIAKAVSTYKDAVHSYRETLGR
jgi:N-acetylmuramoyl-L-alanine amidase